MNLEAFLHDLQLHIDKNSPPGWEVNWEDAPLPYKLYRGLPVFPLSSEVPLTMPVENVRGKADLQEIGHFLWHAYGLTQYSQNGPHLMHRRFVPSGGGLYPSEVYVYLKVDEIPVGVYHYDVAHHRLVLLREGHFDAYLGHALGDRCDVSTCFGMVIVSTMFWKNFFKYNNFAYRLQGLDAGVLLGQLLECAKRFGYDTGVYFQFLDRAVNHLLGLSEQEESVYAVVPLSIDSTTRWFVTSKNSDEKVRTPVTAADLCRELPEVRHEHYVRSKKVLDFPKLIRMNEASMLEATAHFQQVEWKKSSRSTGQLVALPRVSRPTYDLAAVGRKRFSPGEHFVLGAVDQHQLAALLQEATASFSYRNDLGGAHEQAEPRVSIAGCFYGVEGIADGAYLYDGVIHALRHMRSGDQRLALQQGMSLHNINYSQVPLCLHVVGERDHYTQTLGYRGYRIQQMEAGMLVQRLLLNAVAMGMGGHPLLDFDVAACDRMYNIAPQNKTCLIQIPVGPYRTPRQLDGGLHG